MKTIKLTLIKKNRKYFACKVNGYDANLIIDDKSENLELGEHELIVNDLSIRNKYGVKIIYEIACETTGEKIQLSHPRFNSLLVERAKKLGGVWRADEKVWEFDAIVEEEVEELHLLFNSSIVTVTITAQRERVGETGPIYFCGYPLACAFDRDSGAKLGEGVACLEGRYTSGGSRKNWCTIITDGSKFRLQVSKKLIESCQPKGWGIEL